MRTLALFFGLLALSYSAFACQLPADYVPIAQRAPKALLFQVHGCNQPIRYVFGTYHSDSPSLAPIIAHLTPYLEQSKRLWVEIVSAPELLPQTQALLMLPPESPNLQMLVGDALFGEIKAKIAPILGLDEAQLQRFRPWALALLVQYPPPSGDGIILDIKLQQMAARKAVGISGLETLHEQFSIFLQMPDAMQAEFVHYTLANLSSIQASMAQLEALYLQKDIYAIQKLSEDQFTEMRQISPALVDYLHQHLVEKRNARMAQRILQQMPYAAFVAVGALHLTGDGGILSRLEAAGLQIDSIE